MFTPDLILLSHPLFDVSVDEEARDGEPGVCCKLRVPWGWQRPECSPGPAPTSRPAATTVAGAASPCQLTELALQLALRRIWRVAPRSLEICCGVVSISTTRGTPSV